MRLTREHHHKHPRWTSGVRRCDVCGKEEFLNESENWNNCRSCQQALDCASGKKVVPSRKNNYCKINYCQCCNGVFEVKKSRNPAARFCSSKCGASERKGQPIKGERWTDEQFETERARKNAYLKYHYSKTKHKVKRIIRNRLKLVLKRQLTQRPQQNLVLVHTEELLGCSIAEFVKHIESQFVEGMSWENYTFDTWHIDHIIPLSSFDLLDNAQLRLACHYKNMRPLWAAENLAKGKKVLYSLTDVFSKGEIEHV